VSGVAAAGDGGLLSPADDLPVHQVAAPVAVVGTTDRHFYDRYYFCAHHCDDSVAIVTGLGQYPNLGVTDAFLSVTWPGRQEVIRCSRPLDADRLDLHVGPLAVDVRAGLRSLQVTVAPNDTGMEADLTWQSTSPAYLEPRHVNRNGPRVTTDSVRFCQTGRWSGQVTVDGRRLDLDDDSWLGVRDRSWGIRPVGEPEPHGRRYGAGPAGFLWLYAVLQFPDHVLVVIVQEDALGRRSLDHAARVRLDGTVEDLGPVTHALEFVGQTREVAAARLHFAAAGADTPALEVRPMTASYLALGTGYGNEPDWRHGMYQGASAVQRRSFDLRDDTTRRRAYGLVDSMAAAEVAGERGFGLFEYAVLGRNERYGFGGRIGQARAWNQMRAEEQEPMS
jgi:hypothetical protein